ANFKEERKALRETVYLKIREHCRYTFGLDFQVIDMYEGVDPDDVNDDQVRQVRMEVLQECLESSAGPYFLVSALIREQYGSPCLPARIEASEFEEIIQVAQQESLNTRVLTKWYQRDENAVPPAYCLLPKKTLLPHYYSQVRPAIEDFEEMKLIFNAVVTTCIEKETIMEENGKKYFTSGLEEELRFALENRSQTDIKRCLCYIHKIPFLSSQRERWTMKKAEFEPDLAIEAFNDSRSYRMLLQLRDEFLPSVVASSSLRVYTSTSNCELRQGYTDEMKQEFISGLCEHFYHDMLSLIEATVSRNTEQLDTLMEEALQNAALCNIYSGLYRLQCKESEQVKAYLSQPDSKYPLVVCGGPCSGKTVFLAHCAKQVRSWLPECDPVVIARFIRGDCGTLSQILLSICQQMAFGYKKSIKDTFLDINSLQGVMMNLVQESSSQQPLIVILDGVDQISEAENAQSLWWLPKTLPPFAKLLLSTTPKKYGILEALKVIYPCSSQYLHLSPKEKRECSRLLQADLLVSKRKITSGQQVYVNDALKGCTLPLYVEMLRKEVLQWPSSLDVTEESLEKNVHESIKKFLCSLEEKHGPVLVTKALIYLTIPKSGITETELADILSLDDQVLLQFFSPKEAPCKLRVPGCVVAKLLLDLKRFLGRRYIMRSQVLFWTNRHFPLVICRRYLTQQSLALETHNTIANYFNGRWAFGRAKPLMNMQNIFGFPKTSMPGNTIPHHMKIYLDRQQPSQPWLFSNGSALPKSGFTNARKIQELLYHLKRGGKQTELCRSILMNLGFHQAMLKAGRLNTLVSELQQAFQTAFDKELRLLSGILQSSACLLQTSPEELTTVIQTRVCTFLEMCPSLSNFIKQAYHEGLKISSLAVLQSSITSIPSTCVKLPSVGLSPVTDVIDANGKLTIVIQENGTLWAWEKGLVNGFKCLSFTNFKILAARCFKQFLLLSTVCNRLLLYYLSSPLLIDGIPCQPHITVATDVVEKMQGFLTDGSNLFIWFKNTTFVEVFNLNSRVRRARLNCKHVVTCLSLSHDAQYVFCGQQKSTVTIFDTQGQSCQLATFSSDLAGRSVHSLFHCASKKELFWVDNFGNLCVWDVEAIKEPELGKEFCNLNDLDEIVMVEHSLEENVLLLCKRIHIVLWNTEKWVIEDQYRAPKSHQFSHAVLGKICDVIIAALEGCPFLLLWKSSTGQCILTLDTGHNCVLKMAKSQSDLMAVTANGYLKSWDLDLIVGASLVSKTGTKIKCVLVPPEEDYFYTADGTDVVYKWNCVSGIIDANFEHEDLVNNLALSDSGEYLVTSEFSGDIYVWNTQSGENVNRIRSCAVTQILITPNSNVVITLCESNLSTVWKLTTAHIVCNIHPFIKNAVITPESTFVLGLHDGDLLAVSLWSGCVSKRFSCTSQSEVTAFKALLDYPDYVVLLTSCGYLYTWKVSEETICRQFQLPSQCLSHLEMFQTSADGRYAIISVIGATINILDTGFGNLCALEAKGPVLHATLTVDGRYVVFICRSEFCSCSCDFHSKPILSILEVSNGKVVGHCFLCKDPSAMTVSDDHQVYVGFEDGATGIYSIAEDLESGVKIKHYLTQMESREKCSSRNQKQYLGRQSPNIIWKESSMVERGVPIEDFTPSTMHDRMHHRKKGNGLLKIRSWAPEIKG
uniref:NACHT and WD repeat domain containing 2 n=1 Tax=Erpetoichthys calabaricus TaxID=27687 RepID=A0A8C4RIQ1_ERPCA